MKHLLLLMAASAMLVQPALAQAIPDATINTPVSDPITTIALKKVEAGLTLDASYLRVTIAYYKQSGAEDREESVAVTDGDAATAADDLLTGRGPAFDEPLGIVAALGIPLEGEPASPTLALRKRAMTWLAMQFPALFTDATVN